MVTMVDPRDFDTHRCNRHLGGGFSFCMHGNVYIWADDMGEFAIYHLVCLLLSLQRTWANDIAVLTYKRDALPVNKASYLCCIMSI